VDSSQASLGDVAREAGISKTAAGRALRNLPGVSEATRRRVNEIAGRLNYFPDSRLTSWMVEIRKAATKDLVPIVWLNTDRMEHAWRDYLFLSPYQEGARARCKELGYGLEEIWTGKPGFTMNRISRIIDQQGIPGVIVTEPARHVHLNWDRLAGVSIGAGIMAPALHKITTGHSFNLKLALKLLKRFGYQRIGICLTEEADRLSRHDVRSVALYFNSQIPMSRRVKPLFMPYVMKAYEDRTMVAAWLKRERPDVVVGCSSELVNWVQSAGYRVPEDVGVVHLAIEDDVREWAGIHANKRDVGRLAADTLISLIRTRQYGVPVVASTTFVRGSWHSGHTLLIPKANSQAERIPYQSAGRISDEQLVQVSYPPLYAYVDVNKKTS
jgi:LacI family transcriptional regulator